MCESIDMHQKLFSEHMPNFGLHLPAVGHSNGYIPRMYIVGDMPHQPTSFRKTTVAKRSFPQ